MCVCEWIIACIIEFLRLVARFYNSAPTLCWVFQALFFFFLLYFLRNVYLNCEALVNGSIYLYVFSFLFYCVWHLHLFQINSLGIYNSNKCIKNFQRSLTRSHVKNQTFWRFFMQLSLFYLKLTLFGVFHQSIYYAILNHSSQKSYLITSFHNIFSVFIIIFVNFRKLVFIFRILRWCYKFITTFW